jgi:hypothetical protein
MEAWRGHFVRRDSLVTVKAGVSVDGAIIFAERLAPALAVHYMTYQLHARLGKEGRSYDLSDLPREVRKAILIYKKVLECLLRILGI